MGATPELTACHSALSFVLLDWATSSKQLTLYFAARWPSDIPRN